MKKIITLMDNFNVKQSETNTKISQILKIFGVENYINQTHLINNSLQSKSRQLLSLEFIFFPPIFHFYNQKDHNFLLFPIFFKNIFSTTHFYKIISHVNRFFLIAHSPKNYYFKMHFLTKMESNKGINGC